MEKLPTCNKLNKSALRLALIAGLSLSFCHKAFAYDANISLQSITDDVTYLASDALNGRANFSKEIDQAANYIAKRFSDIGLIGQQGNINFKQTFSVLSFEPNTLTVNLNGTELNAKDLAMASTLESFSWQTSLDVQIHFIGADGDLTANLTKLNKQGGQHLVLLHPAQQAIFKRYKYSFQQGKKSFI
jgi:aminopeptidase YwaD